MCVNFCGSVPTLRGTPGVWATSVGKSRLRVRARLGEHVVRQLPRGHIQAHALAVAVDAPAEGRGAGRRSRRYRFRAPKLPGGQAVPASVAELRARRKLCPTHAVHLNGLPALAAELRIRLQAAAAVLFRANGLLQNLSLQLLQRQVANAVRVAADLGLASLLRKLSLQILQPQVQVLRDLRPQTNGESLHGTPEGGNFRLFLLHLRVAKPQAFPVVAVVRRGALVPPAAAAAEVVPAVQCLAPESVVQTHVGAVSHKELDDALRVVVEGFGHHRDINVHHRDRDHEGSDDEDYELQPLPFPGQMLMGGVHVEIRKEIQSVSTQDDLQERHVLGRDGVRGNGVRPKKEKHDDQECPDL
mmetsp:Transcript_57063/g.153354  ORF Transcript_57063/g.153354 Transcript_57063/m.153354 type:complete len:358 (-) Transcript_57063:202-1275(-)